MSYTNPPYYISAYALAKRQGFVGSLDEWLESLIGPTGPQGKTAYEYAVQGGFVGSEEDFAAKMAKEVSTIANAENMNNHMLNTKNPHNVTAEQTGALPETGGAMLGPINMGGFAVTGLANPENDGDAVPLGYVEEHFVPTGYGYADQCLYVQSANVDAEFLNSLTQIYNKLNNQTAQIRFVWNGYYYFGTLWNSGHSGYGSLTAMSYDNGHKVQRICTDGVWGEWEHDNPPLITGVEYRTTKRFNRAPIYQQVLQLGGIAAGTSKTIAHNIANIDYAIGLTLLDGTGTISGSAISERFTLSDVMVTLPSDVGGSVVYAILEYTKTAG